MKYHVILFESPCFTLSVMGSDRNRLIALGRDAYASALTGNLDTMLGQFEIEVQRGVYSPEVEKYHKVNYPLLQKALSVGVRGPDPIGDRHALDEAYRNYPVKAGIIGRDILASKSIEPIVMAKAIVMHLQAAVLNHQRIESAKEVAGRRPYWIFYGIADSHCCATCEILDGKVFAYNDPVWKKHLPPYHLCNRSRIGTASARELKRDGLRISRGAAVMPILNSIK